MRGFSRVSQDPTNVAEFALVAIVRTAELSVGYFLARKDVTVRPHVDFNPLCVQRWVCEARMNFIAYKPS